MTENPAEIDTAFVDVTGISLAQVLSLGDSALGQSLRRLTQELDSAHDAVAGHNSAI